MANPVPEHIGPYRVLRPLGEGGKGTVYLAELPGEESLCILKTLRHGAISPGESAEAAVNLLREMEVLKGLHHRCIPRFLGMSSDDNHPFLVLEYRPGHTLRELLKAGHRFPLPQTVSVLRQLLSVLSHLHHREMIHGDLKPSNLLLEGDGGLVLYDFGSVLRIQRSGASEMRGTPSYMAPERLMGRPADARSDLFAAGVLLYELLTSAKPFSGNSFNGVSHKILTVTPPLPSELCPGVPPGVDQVVMKALAKRPGERFQDAGEFRHALELSAQECGLRLSPLPDEES